MTLFAHWLTSFHNKKNSVYNILIPVPKSISSRPLNFAITEHVNNVFSNSGDTATVERCRGYEESVLGIRPACCLKATGTRYNKRDVLLT